jgi:cobalt/nickel transport system ATP-binding protein
MHHTIEVEDLRFAYPDGRVALRGISLTIAPGEKAALVGPNGAGKSTLLLHLNGVLRGEGQVRVCGVPVNDETLGRVRAMVGLVFQDPDDQLFSTTVYEDVAFGPLYMGIAEQEIPLRVARGLGAVDMIGAEDRVPHHLSSGEKKRVAIATVLAMDPEILVLDEPCAGLDPRTRRGLIETLRGLPQTMLASTHDMRLVQDLFDRVVVIDEGRLVADGSTAEILADARLLEAHGLETP